MVTRHRWLFSSFAVVGALVCGLMMLAMLNKTQPVTAFTTGLVRYVSSTGDDTGNDCSDVITPCRTLQHAVDFADPSDEIKVATGIYTGVQARAGMTQVVYISKTVTIRGGYNASFAAWDPDLYPTTLHAEGQGRVISVIGFLADPTIDSFIITGGDATGVKLLCPNAGGQSDGCGGGVFVHNGSPTIVNNIVVNNVAAVSNLGRSASGGGLCLNFANGSVISGNLIISNTASLGYNGMGGGLHLEFPYDVVVVNNQILSNTATTHNSLYGWGGGIAVDGSQAVAIINDNIIIGNRTNNGKTGAGGAIYNWNSWSHFAYNHVQGNAGANAVYLGGYGVARFEANYVIDNDTAIGIEVLNGDAAGPVLANNIIARSGSKTLSLKTYSSTPMTVTMIHNTLVGNDSGYGIYLETENVNLYLTNTIVVSHTWGITNLVPASSTIAVDHTLFWANDKDGITGTNPIFGNPVFRNHADAPYHLGFNSKAVDAGVITSESVDIDSEVRPFGAVPDIGADESWMWYSLLPVALRSP